MNTAQIWKLVDYYSFCVDNVKQSELIVYELIGTLHQKGDGRAAVFLGQRQLFIYKSSREGSVDCEAIGRAQYYANEAIRLGDKRGIEINDRISSIITENRDRGVFCTSPENRAIGGSEPCCGVEDLKR